MMGAWKSKSSYVRGGAFFRKFHRDEDAQMIIIGAVFTWILVILLTVTVNLAYVTHKKIQAQTAADAAAKAAGIWQIRGLSFVQSLNNAIVYTDAVAYGSLLLAVVLNKAAYAPAVGVAAWGTGNVALGLTVGCHAISQFVLLPFRYMYATFLAPAVCYVSASEMARANNATPALSSLPAIGVGIAGVAMAGSPLADLLNMGHVEQAGQVAHELLSKIDVYAINLDLVKGEIISLNLEYGEADVETPPLFIAYKLLMKSLMLCSLLQPAQAIAVQYFSVLETAGTYISGAEKALPDSVKKISSGVPIPRAAWRHDYYTSKPNYPDKDGKIVLFGPYTWVTAVRESSRKGGGMYEQWTSPWRLMDGLGVKTANGYGELGAVGISAVRVFADPVTWFDPRAHRGWVELVPVPPSDNLMDIGIQH